jgi:hypothetical protein
VRTSQAISVPVTGEGRRCPLHTVRAAREQYFTALAELLRATAARTEAAGLDALVRALDLRLQQLALVARPLTRSLSRPLIWRNNPGVVRHRLTLHADLNRRVRALACDAPACDAVACDALADAATALAAIVPKSGHPPVEVSGPLATAEAHLLPRQPAGDTGPLPPMVRIRWLLNVLAVLPPAVPSPAPPPVRPTAPAPGEAVVT